MSCRESATVCSLSRIALRRSIGCLTNMVMSPSLRYLRIQSCPVPSEHTPVRNCGMALEVCECCCGGARLWGGSMAAWKPPCAQQSARTTTSSSCCNEECLPTEYPCVTQKRHMQHSAFWSASCPPRGPLDRRNVLGCVHQCFLQVGNGPACWMPSLLCVYV